MKFHRQTTSIAMTAIALSAFTLLAAPAQASRLGGAFRAASLAPKAAIAPPLNPAFARANYNGVRAMPHFNTTTAAPKPLSSSIGQPINGGFVQGVGRMQTHRAGTVVLRYGHSGGRYVTTNLNAKPTHVAISKPSAGSADPPRHYYRLTQAITAPTGQIASAHGRLGGATQVVLNDAVARSPMVRTVVPNFQMAATGLVR